MYSYGTIPYLGTFLTDLTMIDTAIPDVVSDGLINFDKRRKEFEVLAQVGLLSLDEATKWYDGESQDMGIGGGGRTRMKGCEGEERSGRGDGEGGRGKRREGSPVGTCSLQPPTQSCP